MFASVTTSDDAIEWLGQLASPHEAVGGKAASLDRLARDGFLVPPGFCVTTAGFRAHLEAVGARAPLGQALAALPAEEARCTVVELVRESPLPASLGVALAVALQRLASTGTTALAVRSSAIGEDSRATSFAGLHDTELGLTIADVDPAVRRCWSSLWSAGALAYRTHKGVGVDGAEMAVVVQALVPADAAAVVFTRHPVTGNDEELVITAVPGLGEPMVSGAATPDTIVVARSSREVAEFWPGDGGERLVATGDGVTRRHNSRAGPALSDSATASLVELSLEVERSFGGPVDIEAALAGDRWYLLQARPITA